ncbi:MAG: Acetyltransferase, partial [uncultured Gemmatimonadetes bacterium]
ERGGLHHYGRGAAVRRRCARCRDGAGGLQRRPRTSRGRRSAGAPAARRRRHAEGRAAGLHALELAVRQPPVGARRATRAGRGARAAGPRRSGGRRPGLPERPPGHVQLPGARLLRVAGIPGVRHTGRLSARAQPVLPPQARPTIRGGL